MHRNPEIRLRDDDLCCVYMNREEVAQLRHVVEHVCNIQPYHLNPALHELRNILNEAYFEYRRGRP